jgi:alkanesulfonate monooxygenase SsuD/methylene tetrahydromethanopterin reductase-like flavin-dependent oxidoreductase (luciferase family)
MDGSLGLDRVREEGAMTSLGAVCWPAVPPEQLRDVAVAADEAGLDELWLWEDCFWGGGVAACAAALAWTTRIRVGIGVMPVPLRNVALAAMETAMLCRMFPDRAIIGVGHGVQEWMGQAGVKAESPMTLLREYLPALRALLRGEKVSASGRYVHLDEVALVWPAVSSPAVSPAPPIFAGAIGPRTQVLSGEIADGTVLVGGTGAAELRAARERIDEGRARAGRADPHRLVVYLEASMDEPAADVAREAAELAGAGADSVVLQPRQPSTVAGDPVGYVRWVAGQVRPLV